MGHQRLPRVWRRSRELDASRSAGFLSALSWFQRLATRHHPTIKPTVQFRQANLFIRDSALESFVLEKAVDLLTETEAPRALEDRESGHDIP